MKLAVDLDVPLGLFYRFTGVPGIIGTKSVEPVAGSDASESPIMLIATTLT